MQFLQFFQLFLYLFLLLLQLSSCDNGSATISRTIIVDQEGYGDFTTVQEAINSVPEYNKKWVRIRVKQGVYWEKVAITSRQNYILLEGEGSKATTIRWDAHAAPLDLPRGDGIFGIDTFHSATFTVLANHFVARDITFENMYDGRDGRQAVAALVGGDQSAFYSCGFSGYQDTLCDCYGRHYFRNCWIEGAVDFIFGYAQSIYEECVIRSIMPPGPQPGWVTAHARTCSSAGGGFVFKYCVLLGTGQMYLGRAWNQYATVVFYKTVMSDVVMPQGWDAWQVVGDNLSLVTFAEHGCIGPGSNTSKRVEWEKQLTPYQIASFVSMKFVDDSGWLSLQP